MKQFPGLITARTYTGATALHLAVSRGNVAVCDICEMIVDCCSFLDTNRSKCVHNDDSGVGGIEKRSFRTNCSAMPCR